MLGRVDQGGNKIMTCLDILKDAVKKEKKNKVKIAIGNYLIKRMETDIDLANAWEEKGLDLDFVYDCVREEARKRAVDGCYAFDEQDAYDFAVHSILEAQKSEKQPFDKDEEVEEKTENKKNVKTKEAHKNEGSLGMQMSLDDLDDCI